MTATPPTNKLRDWLQIAFAVIFILGSLLSFFALELIQDEGYRPGPFVRGVMWATALAWIGFSPFIVAAMIRNARVDAAKKQRTLLRHIAHVSCKWIKELVMIPVLALGLLIRKPKSKAFDLYIAGPFRNPLQTKEQFQARFPHLPPEKIDAWLDEFAVIKSEMGELTDRHMNTIELDTLLPKLVAEIRSRHPFLDSYNVKKMAYQIGVDSIM